MTYVEPEWAQKPSSQDWILTEIKGGIEVEKYNLEERATTILGRALDMVHIPLHHESASRQHARISFDSQGIPWLRDLKSTHGTKVNKRPLPPQVCGKIESNSNKKGSRGIMVYPGDIFQFGASTRIFTLEGPPEFERGALKAKLEQAAAANNNNNNGNSAQPTTSKEPKQDEGVSWGMSMDDDTENDTNEKSSGVSKTLPMDMQVPDKHRKAFDRLNTMKYKLANLESEDGRIKRKYDLTEGQEKQLQRNAEREEALKKAINNLEEELYNKLYPEKANLPKKQSSQSGYHNDDEVDDYFDRTNDKETEGVIEEEESEDSLVNKWKKLYNLKTEERTNSIFPAEKKVEEIQQKLDRLQARNDEDAFFVQNDLSLAKEALQKAVAKQENTIQNMKEIEKLLRIVNPKLQVDRESGYIGEGPPPKEEEEEESSFAAPAPIVKPMLPPPARRIPTKSSPAKRSNDDSDFMAMPPPVLPPPRIRSPSSSSSSSGSGSGSGSNSPKEKMERKRKESSNNNNNMDMPPPPIMPAPPSMMQAPPTLPPPKRSRVVGPSMMMKPPPQSSSSGDTTRETKKALNNPKKPMGTLAFLSSMTKDTTTGKASNGKTGDKVDAKKKAVLDPKKDVWQAPKDQDGSGYTKLNAKFAGRY